MPPATAGGIARFPESCPETAQRKVGQVGPGSACPPRRCRSSASPGRSSPRPVGRWHGAVGVDVDDDPDRHLEASAEPAPRTPRALAALHRTAAHFRSRCVNLPRGSGARSSWWSRHTDLVAVVPQRPGNDVSAVAHAAPVAPGAHPAGRAHASDRGGTPVRMCIDQRVHRRLPSHLQAHARRAHGPGLMRSAGGAIEAQFAGPQRRAGVLDLGGGSLAATRRPTESETVRGCCVRREAPIPSDVRQSGVRIPVSVSLSK